MIDAAFSGLDEVRKVALALAIAEACLATLDADVATLGREALNEAWRVVEEAAADPDAIAQYLDGDPPEKDFGIMESRYGDSTKASAVIAISLAIGYAARVAYERTGRRDWSSIIAEIGEHSMGDIGKFAAEAGCLDEQRVYEQSAYLRRKGTALHRDAFLAGSG